MPGANTSAAEVTNISPHGFWILLDERELFLPFEKFPWFADATVRAITNVERPTRKHLYWPALDVDLSVDSIERPEKYPLIRRRKRSRSDRCGARPPRDTSSAGPFRIHTTRPGL